MKKLATFAKIIKKEPLFWTDVASNRVSDMQNSFDSLRQLDHHIDDTVRLYPNREADDYPAHWHSAIEMILPVENTYTVMVGETAFHIDPGEIFIVPSGVVHEIFAPEDGFRYLFLIDQEEFYAIGGLPEMQHVLYPCVHLRADADAAALEEIRGYFVRAVEAYEREGALAGAVARLWIRLVLARTAEYRLSGEAETSQVAAPRHQQMAAAMAEARGYISQHCAEKLTLDEMADRCGYSRFHFARVFKLYAGMSFYDYYMQQRIALCRSLLSDAGLRVTDAALRAGFDSIATFNRVFKRCEGVTPSQYRRMQQRKRDEGGRGGAGRP